MGKIKMTKKIIIVFALSMLLCQCLTGCETSAPETTSTGYSISDADVFHDIPALRQYGDYSCGATCVQMIMNYLYPYDGDLNLAQYEEALNTSKSEGTGPQNITGFFTENGVAFIDKQDITIDELTTYLKEGNIVMMCIQAWSTADDQSFNLTDSDKENYLIEGHWVICVGYNKDGSNTLFYFNDPACVGHTVMNDTDLENRWIDIDGKGNLFKHYGIIIGCNSTYNPSTAYYLN